MFYKFTFADGHVCWARGMNRNELKWEESKHGKLVSKTKE